MRTARPGSRSGSARLLRLLLVLAILVAALWIILGDSLLPFLGGGEPASSGTASPRAAKAGYDNGYEDDLFEEEIEDASPPSGAISGTAQELEDGARLQQERVENYEKIE